VRSRNVSTEVNTVFQNLSDLLHQIDPAKLNATLTALADGVRGRGQRIGQATSDANQVLQALNPRMRALHRDWRAFTGFSDAYSAAAQDLLSAMDAASTTSATVTAHSAGLDVLLLNLIGLSRAGVDLIGPNRGNLTTSINDFAPTAALLNKYDPVYTCLLLGANWFLDNGGYERIGGNGRTSILDSAILLGDDPYRFPQHLPIVAAKGGPGGKPGCGSLPDVSKNFPVRQLVTNTGWGTGLDIRPNPGIGHPWWVNYLPATRAVPEAPSFRGLGPPAIGPVPYPGAPPYGAPHYGPGGAPLWPGVPPA
jgi:phospholipid/cholesterol/gamma-HCH transport system substrate-binding protein